MDGITFNIADYEEQKRKGIVSFIRLDADLYQFVCRRFRREDGAPDKPDILQVNRAALDTLANALKDENERLRATVARNDQALQVLSDVLGPEMDALDAAATALTTPAVVVSAPSLK